MKGMHPMLVLSPRRFNERTGIVIGFPMTHASESGAGAGGDAARIAHSSVSPPRGNCGSRGNDGVACAPLCVCWLFLHTEELHHLLELPRLRAHFLGRGRQFLRGLVFPQRWA